MGWESKALNSGDDSGAPTPDEDGDVGVTGDETIPPSAVNEDDGEVDFEQQGGKDDETATAGEVGGNSTLPLSAIIGHCTPSSERESTHEQRRPSISASSVESFGTDMASVFDRASPAKLEEDDNSGAVHESGQSRAWKFRAKLRRVVGAISDIILLQSRPDAGRLRVSWNCKCGKRLNIEIPEDCADGGVRFAPGRCRSVELANGICERLRKRLHVVVATGISELVATKRFCGH
ncbi:hypothetical protein QBC33DRAFT_561012 [Phialemonium atrogriseum]|uniref:Uncharacterized protein n=1 Tax=Phialemonium atrogriseum TaxID=1093897 RepID=A0AAJ0BVR2_9PEZI|nr:uncharacterized protein QBC33DRAFT_561012 [Phialemonium atrogriseum]KAK1765190.1 hypothetical protein QBC33DRAFT_561012 [Phialemonium atrogriseum]